MLEPGTARFERRERKGREGRLDVEDVEVTEVMMGGYRAVCRVATASGG